MTTDIPAGTTFAPSLLASITTPAQLRHLDATQLAVLVREIREFLITKVSATGGHLGPNLGVVELTIALHRVFDSPNDRILFDTGHQTYVHKLLTGRRTEFDQLRQAGGLSGYPNRRESAHDIIENSHASTALSYADGLAKAHALRGETADRHVVAVVGDGALTGGMCWEALNNISAAPDRPVIIVLNDNGRSYAPTIGGLAHHLERLRGRYRWKGSPLPAAYPAAGETIFDQLGFAYLGPINGHDITETERALVAAAEVNRPVVVHCVTAKGSGYAPAEADTADRMHGIGVLDAATGRPLAKGTPSWTGVFGNELAAIAADRPDIVALTAAMLQPVGLKPFADAFPDRVFDVGIAEQHAVCSAAGLAMGGAHPVVCLYATFLNRAFDQVLMDVALHQLPVTFVLDRAGITGPDGPSHHGMWDTALAAAVPGLRVAAPRDLARLRELLREAIDTADGPTMVRFPKATAGPDIDALARIDGIDVLHRTPRRSLDVLLVAAGVMATPSLHAAALLEQHGVGVTVADPRWTAPLNPALPGLAARHTLAVTVEDALAAGGQSTALQAACAAVAIATPVRALGLHAGFVPHGDRGDLLTAAGLDGPGIATAVLTALPRTAAVSDLRPCTGGTP